VTIGEVLRFYQRADVLEARGDIGPCAGCGKHFDVGEQLSMYTLKKMNPEYTRPGGILLCKTCTHLALTTPPPAD
jgi:hypothetical protein